MPSMLRQWCTGLFILLVLMGASPTLALDWHIERGPVLCQSSFIRLMTYQEASAEQNKICESLGEWDTARLAGNASISGTGSNCEIRQANDGALGAAVCLIDRSGWQDKAIDTSRDERYCQDINCWEYDDRIRDRLDMEPNRLTSLYKITHNAEMPPDGRYIYVYRKDNQLYLRRYDRADTCASNAYYRYTANFRGGQYLHVRHSQLNGGWSPVWCAGELSIQNRGLSLLNNASGHFKPTTECLKYVADTFSFFEHPKAPDFEMGDFRTVSTSKNQVCGPTPSPPPGPEDKPDF